MEKKLKLDFILLVRGRKINHVVLDKKILIGNEVNWFNEVYNESKL